MMELRLIKGNICSHVKLSNAIYVCIYIYLSSEQLKCLKIILIDQLGLLPKI